MRSTGCIFKIILAILFLIPSTIYPTLGSVQENSMQSEKKRIVICLDGTWNNPAKEADRGDDDKVFKPTNVLKTSRAVVTRAKDGIHQLVYYDIAATH